MTDAVDSLSNATRVSPTFYSLHSTQLSIRNKGVSLNFQSPGSMGLFRTEPGFKWLYLAAPGSALVCHDLPYHRVAIFGLNASVKMGWVGLG